jgi:THAP4-like, heme-binding beta-barrel domain
MSSPPLVHPDIEPIGFLLGTWSGRGHGEHPTIEPFDYDETVTISHNGKAFLSYTQRTEHAVDGRPLHAEVGFWRLGRPDWVEFAVCHPTGVVEIEEGGIKGGTFRLRSCFVACTGSAKEITTIERDFDVDGDRISYTLRMSAVGQPITQHLAAELRRIG